MFKKIAKLSIALLLMAGCATISPYSQKSYENFTSLKVDAMNLIDKAVDPYPKHKPEADIFKIEFEKAYEYAKGLQNNDITVKQLLILKDPERSSLYGFLKRWEDNKVDGIPAGIKPAMIQNAKDLISDQFDTVIGLESGKIKPSDIK